MGQNHFLNQKHEFGSLIQHEEGVKHPMTVAHSNWLLVTTQMENKLKRLAFGFRGKMSRWTHSQKSQLTHLLKSKTILRNQ